MTTADDAAGIEDLRHEMGNASLLLDAALRLLRDVGAASDPVDVARVLELLDDVKRRLDQLSG